MRKSIILGIFSFLSISFMIFNSDSVGELYKDTIIDDCNSNLQQQKLDTCIDFAKQAKLLKEQYDLQYSNIAKSIELPPCENKECENVTYTSCNFQEEDKEVLEYLVQQEVGNLSLKHKRVIVNVIMNRVRSDLFPNTIMGVASQKGQFTGYHNYSTHKYKLNETTVQAVEEVLSNRCEDLSMGAEYFYAPKYTNPKTASWFENNLEFLFELEGHRFFKTKK